MRLRYIEQVDFRRSEITNFNDLRKREPALIKSLKSDDVVLFISSRRTQIVFVWAQDRLTLGGKDVNVTTSLRYRISGSTWNPLMLRDYAEAVGIHLEGAWIKKYEWHVQHLKAAA